MDTQKILVITLCGIALMAAAHLFDVTPMALLPLMPFLKAMVEK